MNFPNDRELEFLIHQVEQERVVLVIGPDLYKNELGTTLEQQLIEYLQGLNNDGENIYARHYRQENLFNFNSSRQAVMLGFEIANFYEKQTPPAILRKLITLPFHLILNFTPDHLLSEAFNYEGFDHSVGYYVRRQPSRSIATPSKEVPVIYNMLGSVQNTESLILKYEDLLEYFEDIFTRDVYPNEIRNAVKEARTFVFLGFPFDRWYMPVALWPLRIGISGSRLLAFTEQLPNQELAWADHLVPRFFVGLEDGVEQMYQAFQEKGFLRVARQERTDIHDDIANYIAQDKLEEAINLLLDRTRDESIAEEALLLSGRYNNLRRRSSMGLIAQDEITLLMRQISRTVLTLSSELKNTSSFSNRSTSPSESLEVEGRRTKEQLIRRRKKAFSPEERLEVVALNTDLLPSPPAEKLSYKMERAADAEAEKDWQEAQRLYEKTIGKNANYLPAWQGLLRVAEQLGDREKQSIAADNTKLLEAIIQFEQNARQPLYLQKLEIKEVASYGSFNWQFQPRMNVLLGRNGYGKSFLLRLVVAMLQNEYEITSNYFANNDIDALACIEVNRKGEQLIISRDKLVFREQFGKIPVLAISDLRFLNRATNEIGRAEGPNADLRENGALHFLQNIPYSDLIQTFLYELCLEYLDNNKSFELGVFKLIHTIVRQLTDDEFRFHSIERRDGARFHVKVITEGNPEPLPIQYASQGTLSVLAIFGLIYKYLRALNPEIEEDKILECPGIVVIDEVDAHLHPTWQQKITLLLKDTFPKVQFVLTAHNPLVVAGCREKEAAVFRKTERGFHIQQFDRHFIGADSTEIYWAIFETEEKDPIYLKYAAMRPFKKQYEEELAKLMSKYHLAEEEQEDLSRINDQIERHLADSKEPVQVTEDLLASALGKETLQRWQELNEKQIPKTEDDARINELNDLLFYIGQYERVEAKKKEERRNKLRSRR